MIVSADRGQKMDYSYGEMCIRDRTGLLPTCTSIVVSRNKSSTVFNNFGGTSFSTRTFIMPDCFTQSKVSLRSKKHIKAGFFCIQ